MIIIIFALCELFDSQKNYIHTETHPFSLSPGYAASRYPWSGLHDWQRLPLICLIPHCKASPVFLDVGGEYCTNARTITVYAFVIQESLCLLALRLTYLAAHPKPQQVQCIRMSTLAATRCVYCSLNGSKTRKRSAVADFEEC